MPRTIPCCWGRCAASCWVQGAAARGDKCHPGHPGIGHPAPPPESHGMPAPGWGRAVGTAFSTGVRLLCLKHCGAEAAPSLRPCIPASLLGASPASPSPGPPVVAPAQSRAVLPPWAGGGQQGQGWGQASWGATLMAGCPYPPKLCSVCCVRLGTRVSRSQGSRHNGRARGSVQ